MQFPNTRLFRRASDVEAQPTSQAAPLSGNQPAVSFAPASKSSPSSNEYGSNNTPATSEKLVEFLEKYDPRPITNLPSLYPMSEHRAMMRTMYLDNILHNAAKLHKHNLILLSRNERYKECIAPDSTSRKNPKLMGDSMHTRPLEDDSGRPRKLQ